MIMLGKTLRDTLEFIDATKEMTRSQKCGLKKYILNVLQVKSAKEISDKSLDLDMQQSVESHFGGYFYFIRDTEESFRQMSEYTLIDIREPLEAQPMRFDVAQYLDSVKSLTVMTVITNPNGGNGYLVHEDLVGKFPTIREHIEGAIS